MDTLLQYYKLKQKYEDNLKKRKNDIKKNAELTFKEKIAMMKKYVRKCVNCGNTGGTIFEERNGMLKAVCGSETPCNLNINIKRKHYDNARELEQKYEKTSENLKMRIIITKLDYLFGINNSKDETVDKFNKLKNELAQISESQLVTMKKYGDIIRGVPSDPLLNDAMLDLANEIEELKKIHDDYLADPAASPAYLSSMIEKTISTINPLTEKIRNMKYGYYVLETLGDVSGAGDGDGEGDGEAAEGKEKKAKKKNNINTYALIARPYRLEQLEQERQ